MLTLHGLLLLGLVTALVSGKEIRSDATRERVKREPAQQDQATEERTNRADIGKVELKLIPADRVDLVQGDDLTFNCKITNKPRNSQVQWYYMIRNKRDNSFDNFTILANEVATVNPDKYNVWTTPPNLYSITIKDMKPVDTGEYCCFLYVSYSQTYRKATSVQVHTKRPPPTTTRRPVNSRSERVHTGQGNGNGQDNTKLDQIIEEAVEHDIESELGRKLNITLIKNNAEARTLIHNATEEIKSLLKVDEGSGMEFNNGTTKLTVTRRMQGASTKVKTVVTTLISRISNVDATLAQALAPLRRKSGQADYVRKPSVSSVSGSPSSGIPDWRKIYNEYKRGQTGSTKTEPSSSVDNTIPEQPEYNKISNTPPPDQAYKESGGVYKIDRETQEEKSNVIDDSIKQPKTSKSEEPILTGKKCQYQLVINEFDPSQCPSIGSNRGPAAAMYYEEKNKQAAAYTRDPIGNAQSPPPASNEQLQMLENKLEKEMANSKKVNKTVFMHDSMLNKTEKMLEKQTDNIANLENLVRDLKGELVNSQQEKKDMENKLTEVMLNVLEVNKRLDSAMKKKEKGYDGKSIAVLSASETISCDRHPNVTHYKDCAEIATEKNVESGVYYIRPLYSACPIPVWCDMDTYPGGWTVLQRREGGAVQFNRDWESYRIGFGQVTGEHWLGNDNLFLLSNQEKYMMRVDLWDFYNSRVYSEYRTFKIDGERDDYKLTVGNYSGTAGDGLKTHNKQKFSTSDRDNDMWQDYHCAYEWEGGWWFTNCWSSYLNGKYYNTSTPPYNGIAWREWKEEQLYKSEIKIRPVYHVRTDAPADEAAEEVEMDPESVEEQADYQNDQVVRHRVPRQETN